ncbi:MAG: molybdenum cofactor guanylyltransferase MobA [Bacteroidales bacterium]|nr:molybdenum cofactor guanylyltransferase MobA [Bacteroidales bacterium]
MTRSPLGPADHPATVGLVIAGGRARRMGGGDKMLIRIGGATLVERATAALRPGCISLVINASGDLARLAALRLPVVADGIPGFAGPLAGILAGLDWTIANAPGVDWLASVPTDCPFLPPDLVARLHAARAAADADIACASSGGRTHPVIGLWPLRLREALRHALAVEDERKVGRFAARYRTVSVEWPTVPIDPFFNVNTPEDVAEAERLLGGRAGW